MTRVNAAPRHFNHTRDCGLRYLSHMGCALSFLGKWYCASCGLGGSACAPVKVPVRRDGRDDHSSIPRWCGQCEHSTQSARRYCVCQEACLMKPDDCCPLERPRGTSYITVLSSGRGRYTRLHRQVTFARFGHIRKLTCADRVARS